MRDVFALKGDICYSLDQKTLHTVRDGYLVCEDGLSHGVFDTLPERYAGVPLTDCSGMLILPGLCDLHMHAPQYAFRGLGMDLELLEWLNTRAFPEESKYIDIEYARRAYARVVEDLRRGPNTRVSMFATLHRPATVLLMEMLEGSGLVTMVGKVNTDRNASDILCETCAAESDSETRCWLEEVAGRFVNTRPILTPRFIPSCSDDLMRRLAAAQREYGLPVQSHLSENPREVAWVAELCPGSTCYGDAYLRYGLFGGEVPTVMAHCVWSGDVEIELLRERGVFVAHCPQSNTNLSSGIAPVRRFLERGVRVGLGSDVAGGVSCVDFSRHVGCHPGFEVAVAVV